MNDPFLVSVLDRLTDRHEKLQSLAWGQLGLVAVFRDRDSFDQFHDEVGLARRGSSCVEHLGDVGVFHDRQGLSLGFEPGDHLAGAHPRLDDFHGHSAAERVRLLGQVDDPHPPFTDLLKQLVRADHRAGIVRSRRLFQDDRREDRVFHEVAGDRVCPEQSFDFVTQAGVVGACLRQVSCAFAGRTEFERPSEDQLQVQHRLAHGGHRGWLIPRLGMPGLTIRRRSVQFRPAWVGPELKLILTLGHSSR